ncbi:uncharacterized protein LOC113160083 [Anabas testudineus]|uniref:Ig-like domain-containing protein n=1 Tax=Anabas testudineus TaxID=64144 RepID=A0A3Q1H5Z5_ANATE|nr:uncharacterized protein LOC113160083 [Anabas testudineus]
MIGRLAALILLSTLSQSQEVPDQMSFTVAECGDNLTLMCSVTGNDLGLFYWYKLKFGYMVQTVASGSFDTVSLQGQFDNSRYTVTKVGQQYNLNIRNVSKEDEAIFFCQAGTAYTMSIFNGTLLAVNDHKNLQKSVYMKQSPETASVVPGDSVTLKCSLLSEDKCRRDQCPDDNSVYWFRSASGRFNPGFIYTHSMIGDEQEGRSCVYSFSKTIWDSSDTGTYYCAVITCGKILFGEGTTVETGQKLWPLIVTLGLLACCVIVIIVLIVSRKQKPVCEHYNRNLTAFSHGGQDRSAEDQPSNVNGETGLLNYVVLDFPRRPKRWKNKVELPQESLYSFMRD